MAVFCVANAENASGGSGLTPANAREIFSSGVDVITMGDHVWKRKELIPVLETEPRILRPYNYSPLAAGAVLGTISLAAVVAHLVLALASRPCGICPRTTTTYCA